MGIQEWLGSTSWCFFFSCLPVLECIFWSVFGSCLGLWPLSSLPFYFLHFLAIFEYLSVSPLKPEFTIILLFLEADTFYVVSIQSYVICGMILPSHLANKGHSSPKGLHINPWRETLKFITIPRTTILQAYPDGEILLFVNFIFQGYHITNVMCLFEVSLVTEVQMRNWFIFPITTTAVLCWPTPLLSCSVVVQVLFSPQYFQLLKKFSAVSIANLPSIKRSLFLLQTRLMTLATEVGKGFCSPLSQSLTLLPHLSSLLEKLWWQDNVRGATFTWKIKSYFSQVCLSLFGAVLCVAELNWMLILCPGTVLGAGEMVRIKEDKVYGSREFKFSEHPNVFLLRMLWVTSLEDSTRNFLSVLQDTDEVGFFLFHSAPLSSNMDNKTSSLFQKGSLWSGNIPSERWLKPQITCCSVYSICGKW